MILATRATAHDYRRALTGEEVSRLLAVAPPHRRAVYRMALETGLRRCELMGLRWEDFALPAPAPGEWREVGGAPRSGGEDVALESTKLESC